MKLALDAGNLTYYASIILDAFVSINYAQIYVDLICTMKPIIIIFIINYDWACKTSHVNANYTMFTSKCVSIPFLQISKKCPLNSTLVINILWC